MSILYRAGKRKRIPKNLILTMTLSLVLAMLIDFCFPGRALAGGIGDVVTGVVNANFSSTEFEFSAEDRTGLNIKMHAGMGEYGGGGGGVTVLGPTDAAGMQALLKYVDGEAKHTSIQTVRMKGAEVREYTMDKGVGVGVVLPDYFITVELYMTGNSSASDISKAKAIAQQTLDGLERNGLLSQAAPDIEKAVPVEEEQPDASAGAATGKPLDEPVKVSDTMNVAGVHNKPTAPTTFSINRPHLVTFISTYHWNNARGAAGGTIALQGGDGKTYGPWRVSTRPGQGGVPNAYWEVSPNIVIPAGTYTILDSDPGTWSQNQQSGGRGMAEVKATPNFEAAGGSGKKTSDPSAGGGGWTSSPAGVGPVGNIPGPSNTTEAVVGVAVPGLIATGLGALAGLGGGGGGFSPPGGAPLSPAGGGGSWPGAGGSAAGAGAQRSVPVQEAGQLGRRRYEPDSLSVSDIRVDTAEMGQGAISVSSGEGIFIEPAGEAAIFVQPEPGIIIDTVGQEDAGVTPGEGIIIETAGEASIFARPEPGIIIDTATEEAGVIRPGSGILTDETGSVILLDTSALDGEMLTEGGPGVEEPVAAAETVGIIDERAYDQEGYNSEGFNKEGFDREGFDQDGFDKEGFDKAGFDAKGYDREGFNQAGFDREGFNREGFDRSGFDREGFNKEGFDKAGFDKEGFDKAGFDAKGYDREGFNREGFNADGYDHGGFDKAGFDAQGYDREGFNKAGFDREGYGRNGFDKEGRQRDGSDEYGYGKDGFNEDGFDKDGYDREGFNYEGYNRNGYDPWGYNKQGYDKVGYHWSGYNADGYNRSGRHWTENPYTGDSPFNVSTGSANPFAEDREVIASVAVEMDADGNIIGGENLADSWKPEKPPLGEPYPKTMEKYGAKPWTDEIPQPEPEKATVSQTEDTGVIGPEDPWNTLKKHGMDKDAPMAGKEDVPIPAAEAEGPAVPEAGLPGSEDMPSAESGMPGWPQDGEKRILVGKTDGRSIEIEYDGKTGEWINTESGNIIDPDRFEQWQNDLAEDRRRAAEDIEKMIRREDAASKAIDQNLADWKRLEQMQKAAEKYGVGEKGGPGDVDKAIQGLKDDMLAGKEIDRDRMEQINKIIDNRIKGTTAADTGERWEEVPWYKDLDSALKANLETAREVVLGEKEDGSISWVGMGARVAIAAATGGASEYVMTVTEAMHRINDSIDKGETGFRAVAKAIGQLILEEAGGELIGAAGGKAMQSFAETFPNFTNKAGDVAERIGLAVAAGDQIASRKLGMIGKQSAEEALADIAKRADDIGASGLRRVLDDKIADAGLKVASADDLAKAFGKGTTAGSDDLAQAVGKAAAGGSDDIAGGAGKAAAGGSDDIARGAGKAADGPDLPGQKAAGAADDAAGAAGKTAPVDRPAAGARTEAEVLNDPKAVARAEDSLQKNVDNFDKLPEAQKQQLIKDQAVYDEYRLQAEEKNWELADKVQRGEELNVDDALKLKSDPAAMRKLKEIQEIDGLGAELGDHGAKNVQMTYNETLNKNVYEPSYDDVKNSLKDKYGEVRVETIRTPGKEYHPWDVNTDNDIIAQYKVIRNGKEEWVEIPRGEWEDTYFKSYAQNTGFEPHDAAQKFPHEDWSKMTPAEQYRKWGELHGESPTDVYHPEGARDFSTQRTAILEGQAPDRAAAAQAARGEGELLDPEQLGMMEKNKIDHYWEKGDVKSQTEAMEQLRKASSQARNLEQGYKDMGYKIADMPENMKKAMDVVNDNSLSPASRAAQLKELGYDSPGDFVDKLTSRIGALRAAQK